jgi:serine/threonine protein kinase
MEAERWQAVERLYHATLECEESQRAAFLTHACDGDESLRREVESLISYGNRAGNFIEGSALEVVAPALAREEVAGQDPASDENLIIGKRIAQYRIVEQLGSGGMGEVYRAVRADDQFEKQVAIKLVHAGEASSFIIGRFKKERQILASLDHPNIARLLDGGVTDEGVPYFVMELVEGQSIDKYCDTHRLGIPTRLQLFLHVCSALQYSHQHQIIHRDIKPANILVTVEGVPKLLDFGIAKILDHSVVAGPVGQTQTRFRAFTPEYASPEQIKAEPIGTASDVYSLGVLLYELLTGHRPYRFKTRTPSEIERSICEEEPLKPSAVVTRVEEQIRADGTIASITAEQISSARNSDPKRMHNSLVGDLDAIVMMALRKEPHRRYASVDNLSEDIRKNLEGRPINARPSTIAYRGAKFVRRHRELAVSALIFLVLLGSLAIWPARQIRNRGAINSISAAVREIVRKQLTGNLSGDPVAYAAISRDGRYLAYSGTTSSKMHLLEIDSGKLRELTFADLPRPLDWYPDGSNVLGFRAGHPGLWKMSIRDETFQRVLTEDVAFPVISPDGTHIAFVKDSHEIWITGSDGEHSRRVLSFDEQHSVGPLAWSQSGQRLAYVHARGQTEVALESCNLEGQVNVVLSEPRLWGPNGLSTVYWLPDGRILYSMLNQPSYSNHDLWALAADPETGKRLGRPARVTNVEKDQPLYFQASADGRRFIYLSTRTTDAMYLADMRSRRKGSKPRRLTMDEWFNYPTEWTRDSKSVIFHSLREGRRVILKQDIGAQSAEVLISGEENYSWPALSPAGDQLLFTASPTSDRLDPSKRIMLSSLGGGERSVVFAGDNHGFRCPSAPSADCILAQVREGQIAFSVLDPAKGKGAEIQRVDVDPLADWSLSPDGSKIAIGVPNLQDFTILILTIANHRVTVLPHSGEFKDVQHLTWAADGKSLFATAWLPNDIQVLLFIGPNGNLQVVDETSAGKGWFEDMRASPDGRYLAYTKRIYDTNVVLLENF